MHPAVLLRRLTSSTMPGWSPCLPAQHGCLPAHPNPLPLHGNTRTLANGRSCIGPIQGDNGDSPADHAGIGPYLSAIAQCVIHSAYNWLCACSPLAAMNPHRPGGGPRQHYRPDGSRRRTAGELAKRAAKAAARAAAAAADAAGGGAAKPAGPVVAKDGTSAGAPAQVPGSVTTAPLGVPSASTSTSASSTAGASTSAPKSGPAPAAYPSRVQHPPPSIAAGPKPGGGEHRTWLPCQLCG